MSQEHDAVARQAGFLKEVTSRDRLSRAREQLDETIHKQLDVEGIRQGVRERAGYADTMVAALKRQVDPLLSTLKPDEEIGALLTSFGVSLAITVTRMTHEDPHLIVIEGVDAQDEHVTLFQHVSQVNILFKKVKVKPGKEPRRIGFF